MFHGFRSIWLHSKNFCFEFYTDFFLTKVWTEVIDVKFTDSIEIVPFSSVVFH
jgi:hypothetical protein